MKSYLLIALMMSCMYSCSQSHDIAGEYEKTSKNGSVQHLLKLHPNGTFHFDSYAIKQIEGNLSLKGNLTAEPGISGRGKWRRENDIIHFETYPDTDIDHNYPLNFNDTKARIRFEPSRDAYNEKAITKLEFLESGIFWISGTEFEKRL